MESVAGFFGKKVLRDVDEETFLKAIPEVRKVTGDRAVVRAIHFYNDSRRAGEIYEAIKADDFDRFLRLIIEGGHSSFEFNQNAYSIKNPQEQGVPLALAISQKVLNGRGAWRLQGGGFAGTIQAFVPLALLETYKNAIDAVFGAGSCHVLSVRNYGAEFTEFGNMIVRGLINGLLAGLGQIKSAISTIGESTIGWFKEKLGIHSPSRVFAELGGFTMAGLQQGLVAGQSGPLGTISDLGKRLAAAGALVLGGAAPAVAIDNRPPINAAVAPAVIQGDTYNITIQAGPGTDTAALRRMLEQMLDERERGKAARARSRLGDRE